MSSLTGWQTKREQTTKFLLRSIRFSRNWLDNKIQFYNFVDMQNKRISSEISMNRISKEVVIIFNKKNKHRLLVCCRKTQNIV